MSNSATHGLQHARLPCPSSTQRTCSDSCSLSQWCHPAIASSVFPSSSCLQSFPASGSFSKSQFFTSEVKVLELQLQHQSFQRIVRIDFFRMGWLNLLAVQRTLKHLLQQHSSKVSVLWCSVLFMVQLSHPYMTIVKATVLTRWTFVDKVTKITLFLTCCLGFKGFSSGSDYKASACNAGDLGSIPGLGSSPGERNGHPL